MPLSWSIVYLLQLEGLEEEIVQEVSGRYVPSRSTPRDDMESSIERVEVTEKVKRPQQISPRDKKVGLTIERVEVTERVKRPQQISPRDKKVGLN